MKSNTLHILRVETLWRMVGLIGSDYGETTFNLIFGPFGPESKIVQVEKQSGGWNKSLRHKDVYIALTLFVMIFIVIFLCVSLDV